MGRDSFKFSAAAAFKQRIFFYQTQRFPILCYAEVMVMAGDANRYLQLYGTSGGSFLLAILLLPGGCSLPTDLSWETSSQPISAWIMDYLGRISSGAIDVLGETGYIMNVVLPIPNNAVSPVNTNLGSQHCRG